LVPLPQGGPLERLGGLAVQPAVKAAWPWFLAASGLGALALAYAAFYPAPQRILYGQLDDSQRAAVATALDTAAIGYRIDGDTGAITVDEADLYRARMVVASDGGLGAPESGIELLDTLPLGASRTLEGERLKTARERELMLTIKEIDGVESVRVHIAEPDQSVFVRDSSPPSASVMLRLASGKQLSNSQVTAIANLVANSVPGLTVDAVRIVDQHGRLLSQDGGQESDALELQVRMEEKLRAQVAQLLTPVLGEGNFASEIQVELDLEERSLARESYDREGAVRQETEESSRSSMGGGAVGIPGMTSNTPPPLATAQVGSQAGQAPRGAPQSAPPAELGETRSSRSYELGREVSVSSVAGGGVKRLSAAVVLSASAMKGAKPAEIEKIRQLVSAAVGADTRRGDQVQVIVRNFAQTEFQEPAFYETAWFATILRYAVALIGLLLVILLGMRPILQSLRASRRPAPVEAEPLMFPIETRTEEAGELEPAREAIDRSLLNRQVGAAQKLASERPDKAVIAIRQMLTQARAGEPA
jgi:flagellar M-ring protein FliF